MLRIAGKAFEIRAMGQKPFEVGFFGVRVRHI